MDFFSMEQNSKSAEYAGMKSMLNALIPVEARPEYVGRRVQAVREALELRPSQLADAIDLDRSSLTKIEKGVMGLAIANALKLETRYGIGIRFTYRGDFGDLREDLRDRVSKRLAKFTAE